MHPSIAITGIACIYPDARTPAELWENVLAQRRAFRRIPSERLRSEDYFDADPATPDRTYSNQAAVIAGYEFDRVNFRVVGSTFRSADLAHWLALDVASRALTDAGFPEGKGLPRETTGVLLGNSLTGEFSRANLMRLRWPYVRRVVETALQKENWPAEARQAFLDKLESDYKSPFPPIGEETLAGGLSNTIAGRICNQFDLKGGGYTVDGACASSLLAVANACSALTSGDLDVALAGGVDLSLDPFELVGFAKTGALASEEMRVYDRRSTGFWPGEGCGFVTLMRHQDALAQGCRVYAVIRGWGISSDGSGGITRPEAEGQLEALRRAYRRAGFGIDTVSYFEGHGTGTSVGDETELSVLSRARRESRLDAPPAAIGSIKANIGHTKAAAGVAGVLKAVMALHKQVLPPATGVEQPHEKLTDPSSGLRLLRSAERWPKDRPLRASVSAMGFGGINAHLVLENAVGERRSGLSSRERQLSRSQQDAELFLLAAPTPPELSLQATKLLTLAPGLSLSELADLAAQLQKNLQPAATRAAIVAATPAELAERLRLLISWLKDGSTSKLRAARGVFLGSGQTPPRIGFLFPGQGSPTHLDGGIWRRRFDSVRHLYARVALPKDSDGVATQIMQPAIVTASLAGLKVLEEFGLDATEAIGHSLGEITALHWAGVMSDETLVRIARVRGAAMAALGSPTGGMLAISAPWQQVQEILNGEPLTIVGFNSPRQTVVAGELSAIGNLARSANAQGWQASVLPVSHAFHTPLVAAAVPVLALELTEQNFVPCKRRVFSTITGRALEESEDLRALLCRQVTSPVRFASALSALLGEEQRVEGLEPRRANEPAPSTRHSTLDTALPVDLLIEVGPGAILTGLVHDAVDVPTIALDAGGPSLKGLLEALGAAFTLGAAVRTDALFADRFTRPFSLTAKQKFLVNPCELAPVIDEIKSSNGNGQRSQKHSSDARHPLPNGKQQNGEHTAPAHDSHSGEGTCDVINPFHSEAPLELVRKLVADRAELPVAAIQDSNRMLSDLHLNSITVGQLVAEAARRLGVPRVVGLTDFANASVSEMARALNELKLAGGISKNGHDKRPPPGVDVWFECFTMELLDAQRPPTTSMPANHRSGQVNSASWQILAPAQHPFAATLREELFRAGGNGIVVCLPEMPNEDHLELLLEGARMAIASPGPTRFIVAQHGWGGGGFARTLHLEMPALVTAVVNVPPDHPRNVEWIVGEAMAASGFTEAHYDSDGRRREPRLRWSPLRGSSSAQRSAAPLAETNGFESTASASLPLGPGDVLLVSGGGKGIAAECALTLGRAAGARLALLGRSDPATDKMLAENLGRIAAAGVECFYVRADVTDACAVQRAVAEVQKRFGHPVTGLIHAAGANAPQLIGSLDVAAFKRTLAPKVQGAQNLLAALNPELLKLFITFSSIIGRAGLHGQGDYATANEWLSALTEQFQRGHPQCRCLALEWSVWSGVGMGERLGRLEALIQQGITPIPPEAGVKILLDLLKNPPQKITQVVTGRFGQPPTLKLEQPDLPLGRFLEHKRIHYPGVELIVDVELSVAADLYLEDHVLQKQKLFPAVLGLEAMAQAAMALVGSGTAPHFEQVEFTRPVAVLGDRATIIRLAALRRSGDSVEVCLRSEETDFQVDHFRAVCHFRASNGDCANRFTMAQMPVHAPALVPAHDLYGRILFHTGRFCRLSRYQLLSARECIAEISPDAGAPWFGPYLPNQFVLGDPGARDAALHAIQACIPHRRILPTGIDSIVIVRKESGARVVRAKERQRDGNNFIYDVQISDTHGELIEHWEGLRLRAVEQFGPRDSWPDALLGPYVERRLEEIFPTSSVRVVVEHNGTNQNNSSDFLKTRSDVTNAAFQQALGHAELIWRRGDGKPLLSSDESVSASHLQELTLAVAAQTRIACDLEQVTPRSAMAWRDLLGKERMKLSERIHQEQPETIDTAATRLWSAVECMKKAGLTAESPLVLISSSTDGWILFRAGSLMIATGLVQTRGVKGPMICAIAIHSQGTTQHVAKRGKTIA